jgi:hypothetical protein
MSRRQVLKYGGVAAAVPLLPGMRPARKTIPMDVESNWRWCYRCQGMFFGGNATFGACPAPGGGPHSDIASGNYTLTQGSGSGESDWRWCDRCQGLWFAGNGTSGVCPAGGGHSDSGSGDYFLIQGSSSIGQSDWRWCDRCQGLWFAGNGTSGACPAGGGHSDSGSGNYFLPQQATPAQISLVAGSIYTITGTGWVPGTTVVVTTLSVSCSSCGGLNGGPYNCPVNGNGSIFSYLDDSSIGANSELAAYAVDSSSHQSATTTTWVGNWP